MALQVNAVVPDFEAETTDGKIKFHDWIGNSWALLFSHPKDFTPVCTTELGALAKLKAEIENRDVKMMGLSVDPGDKHAKWSEDIRETQGAAPNYPIIGDTDFKVSKLYDMLPAATSGDAATRTAADNQTVRNVFIIGPDKKIKLVLVYPMTTGRNFQEILRVIDSLQMTAKHRVATPADWKQGEDVIIAGSVTDDEAKTIYPQGWRSPKPYIRIVPQPKGQLARGSQAKQSKPSFREGALAPDPESRHSGFDASHRPGMTRLTSRREPIGVSSPTVADCAVTNVPHETSTATTAQVQCFNSDSEVNSNLA